MRWPQHLQIDFNLPLVVGLLSCIVYLDKILTTLFLNENSGAKVVQIIGQASFSRLPHFILGIEKTLDTNGIKGFPLLIHLNVLLSLPRMDLRAEHIPFNLFCFNKVLKNVLS